MFISPLFFGFIICKELWTNFLVRKYKVNFISYCDMHHHGSSFDREGWQLTVFFYYSVFSRCYSGSLCRSISRWTSSVEQYFNNFSFLALWWLNIVAVVIFFLIFRFFNYWLCFHLPINSRSSSSNFLLSNDIFVNKNCPQIEPEPCECVSALKWKQVQCTLFLNTLKTNFDAFQHQARAFWLPEKCLIPKHIEVCFEGPTR